MPTISAVSAAVRKAFGANFGDAFDASPVVQEIVAKVEDASLEPRRADAKALAALPAKYEKRRAAAGAHSQKASAARLKAVEAMLAATEEERAAFAHCHSLEMQQSQEATLLHERLFASCSPLIDAAWRATQAFSCSQFEPRDGYRLSLRRDDSESPHARRENDAADRLANEENAKISARYRDALQAVNTARGQLRAAMLEPLTEADSAERVSEVFVVLNEKLRFLNNSPYFAVDEQGDVRVRLGGRHDDKLMTIKTAEVVAARDAAEVQP